MNFFSTKFGFNKSLLKKNEMAQGRRWIKAGGGPRQEVAQGRVPFSTYAFVSVDAIV